LTGFAMLYGREGQEAVGDPQVAELLRRTTENQYRATSAFSAEVVEQTKASHPWLDDVKLMPITNIKWLASILWQMATSYLDGVVLDFANQQQLPSAVYQECDALCDLAAETSLKAIQLQSRLADETKPAKVSGMSLPSLQSGGSGYAGVWRALEAVYLQVRDDFAVFEKLQTPKSMRTVQQSLREAFQPKADMFAFLQANWRTAISAENRIDIVRQAEPIALDLFRIGQQLWSPVLLNQIYQAALKYKPSLEELELGFDPWILTDAKHKQSNRDDSQRQQELSLFWESLENPQLAQQAQAQLDAAVQSKRIRLRTGRGYNIVPWQAQYLVRFPVSFGGRTFETGDLIGLYVTAENADGKRTVEVRKTGKVREILDFLGQRTK
jgi:hypothetical protein